MGVASPELFESGDQAIAAVRRYAEEAGRDASALEFQAQVTANLNEAKRRLGNFESEAETWWKSQEDQWKRYNATQNVENRVSPPNDEVRGGVTFGYTGSGKKPLWQADWIQRYNGSRAHWIVWENQDTRKAPGWEINDTGYVQRVLAASACP